MYIKGYITCNDMNQASYMKASLKSLILIQNLHRYNLRLFKAFDCTDYVWYDYR